MGAAPSWSSGCPFKFERLHAVSEIAVCTAAFQGAGLTIAGCGVFWRRSRRGRDDDQIRLHSRRPPSCR
eukprot:2735533-Pyramimonas_sp.AAC.1